MRAAKQLIAQLRAAKAEAAEQPVLPSDDATSDDVNPLGACFR